MGDSFSEVLYAAVLILFWLGPTLLKFFKKKRKLVVPAPPKTKRSPSVSFLHSLDNVDNSSVSPSNDLVDKSLTADAVRELSDEIVTLEKQIDGIEVSCKLHSTASRILPILIDKCVQPLAKVKERLGSVAGLADYEVDYLAIETKKIGVRVETLETIVSQRVIGDTGLTLKVFDITIQESLSPLLLHARRLDLGLGKIYGVAAINKPGMDLAAVDIPMVSIDPMLQQAVSSWSELASCSARAFWDNLRGGRGRVYSELGLPDPTSSISYFLTTGRLSLATLAAGWLPMIFADTVAALQLGPGFAAGLGQYIARGGDKESAVTAMIHEDMTFGPLPNHLRMYIACVVLRYLGFEEESDARFKTWDDSLGNPTDIVLHTGKFSDISLPMDRVAASVNAVIEAFIERPLSIFGGYPLAQIPGLATDERGIKEIGLLAQRIKSESIFDVEPMIALSAIILAVEDSPQFETRIKNTYIKLMLGSAEGAKVKAQAPMINSNELGDLFASPGFWGRAVAASTILSTNTGGK